PEDAVGTTVNLEVRGLVRTPDGNFRPDTRSLSVLVAGVWDPPGGQHGFSAEGLVLPLETVKELPGVEYGSALERLFQAVSRPRLGYGRAVVRVRRASDLFAVEKELQQLGFRTQTFLGKLKELRTGFIVMDLILTAVGSVALTVAGLGIVNTQLM